MANFLASTVRRKECLTLDQRATGDADVGAAVQRRSRAVDRLAGGEAASAEKSCRARMLRQWPTMASLTSPAMNQRCYLL